MRGLLLLVALAALAVSTASGQPVAPDSVARRPDFSVPVTGDFAPPQTSAVRAYVYSVAATAVPIAAGVLLLQISDPSDTPGQNSLGDFGGMLMIGGVWFGPAAGNLSLGAGTDVRRGAVLTVGGFLTGVVLGGAGVAITGVCIVDDLANLQLGDGDCTLGPLAVVLFVAGAAAVAAGTVAGLAYNLATIPRNAATARRYRRTYPRVAVAPGWRAGRPALAVRVGL